MPHKESVRLPEGLTTRNQKRRALDVRLKTYLEHAQNLRQILANTNPASYRRPRRERELEMLERKIPLARAALAALKRQPRRQATRQAAAAAC